MKKIVFTLGMLIVFNNIAFADGNAFTPLNFNDSTYNNTTQTVKSAAKSVANDIEEAVGNGNIQNAVQQLENAQVDIRNDLLNCKTKFADIDAQFKLIKAERKSLQKQTKTIEKRIKELDKAKEKIRKNML